MFQAGNQILSKLSPVVMCGHKNALILYHSRLFPSTVYCCAFGLFVLSLMYILITCFAFYSAKSLNQYADIAQTREAWFSLFVTFYDDACILCISCFALIKVVSADTERKSLKSPPSYDIINAGR